MEFPFKFTHNRGVTVSEVLSPTGNIQFRIREGWHLCTDDCLISKQHFGQYQS